MNATLATGVWNCTNDEYYADSERISHSMLEVFRRSIPEYFGRFVAKTLPAPEPTEAMAFGTLFHAALLEPERWERRVRKPKFDRRTKIGKADAEAWESWVANDPALLVVEGEQEATIEAMRQSVMRHAYASWAMTNPGRNELAIVWEDATTGLACKAKIDRVLNSGLIIDLKTTANPHPRQFGRDATAFGYHRQTAHYLDGAATAIGADGPFLHIAVGKTPPHEVLCVMIDDTAVSLGRQQNAGDLAELHRAQMHDTWDSRFCGIETVELPPWAFNE